MASPNDIIVGLQVLIANGHVDAEKSILHLGMECLLVGAPKDLPDPEKQALERSGWGWNDDSDMWGICI